MVGIIKAVQEFLSTGRIFQPSQCRCSLAAQFPAMVEHDIQNLSGKLALFVIFLNNIEGSPLYQRLTQNRMPAGINPSETRDHPNLRLLERWIAQGARCD